MCVCIYIYIHTHTQGYYKRNRHFQRYVILKPLAQWTHNLRSSVEDENFFSRLSFVTSASRQRPWHRWSKMVATEVEKAFCVLKLAKTNSVTLVQRHFRRRYGKPPPTRQSIYDWSKKFQETGCLCKGRSSGRPPVSEETLERVRETFTRSPEVVLISVVWQKAHT